MQRIILALLALLAAAPAAGQEWLVNRERFRYIGTRLTIDVVADGDHLARAVHPDVSTAPDAAPRFAALADAYEQLTDPNRPRPLPTPEPGHLPFGFVKPMTG